MKKKTFELSREELNRIIEKVLEKYKEEINTNGSARTSKPPKDEDEILSGLNYGNPKLFELLKKYGKDSINESLMFTFDPQKTKNIVCRKFNLFPSQFYIIDNTNGQKVDIILPENLPNATIGEIKHLMGTCGYFQCFDIIHDNGYIHLFFEAHLPKDVTKEVISNLDYLFHATPTIYVNKILKLGLSPKHKNTLFFYPSRIYCMKGNNLSKEQISTLKNVQNQRKKGKHYDDNQYTILTIDTSKLPNGIKFYVDPNAPDAVYTHQNIPPNAISIHCVLEEENNSI